MKNININWLKDDKRKYTIEKLKNIKDEIINCSNTYKNVFNGEPFYEDWSLDSSLEVISSYLDDNAFILTTKFLDDIIGFLVLIKDVPNNQKEYVQYLDNVIFIEEIEVLSEFRKKGIASEMVRSYLLNYLNASDKFIEYRTNAMRYFDYNDSESFESAVERVQKDDKLRRNNKEDIIIPKFSLNEKQIFINKYIELIQYRPDLDVSHSNALFRNIFGYLDFSKIGDNYCFQIDPTGEGNDRIFPIIDLSNIKKGESYENKENIKRFSKI